MPQGGPKQPAGPLRLYRTGRQVGLPSSKLAAQVAVVCPVGTLGQRPRLLLLLPLPLVPARVVYLPFIIGNISFTMVIAAGPTSTTKIAGKMKITSGKISLTAVLAAFSSAS